MPKQPGLVFWLELTERLLQIDTGTNILVAGLSIQVASLFAFSACSIEFLWRARKHPDLRNPNFTDLVASTRFKLFLFCKSSVGHDIHWVES